MANIDLTSKGWIDLVFEGKNKDYGAYKLRKNTSHRNIFSMVIILAIALLIAG